MATDTYNVYHVAFRQQNAPDHVAIALVPTENSDQGTGRFYHVHGDVGLGMEYEGRPGYSFAKTKSYKGSTFQFTFPKSELSRFEEIAQQHKPPHDERALMESNPDPPIQNCSDWVNDVLAEVNEKLTVH
ncbi:hypothetical protein BDV28DRAFT_159019 [Aspergillus coremiiformis]|uniref:Uncharacterized protein n=1 Tax=Aspergillus coremiiformis TaxID=138285 RepID=A0A5N6Z0E0_9EURO|nr:hypothetical protein BDV28DRAFT_159019 [Aspergillus coremiiformis]